MPDFAARLAAIGWRPVDLQRFINARSRRQIAASTISRFVTGQRQPSPEMDALLAVIEKPELLEELRK